jgi:hypothetical protein
MTNRDSIDLVCEISGAEAARVVGGAVPSAGSTTAHAAPAGFDIDAVKRQAQAYCPATVARYSNVTPANVTRASAQSMANSCLTEMGPLQAMFARGPIQHGIDQAFPARPGQPGQH